MESPPAPSIGSPCSPFPMSPPPPRHLIPPAPLLSPRLPQQNRYWSTVQNGLTINFVMPMSPSGKYSGHPMVFLAPGHGLLVSCRGSFVLRSSPIELRHVPHDHRYRDLPDHELSQRLSHLELDQVVESEFDPGAGGRRRDWLRQSWRLPTMTAYLGPTMPAYSMRHRQRWLPKRQPIQGRRT